MTSWLRLKFDSLLSVRGLSVDDWEIRRLHRAEGLLNKASASMHDEGHCAPGRVSRADSQS